MNKLFKDMFVQNLKKDRSIFLSIFLFLILSFSTMLGIFNFSLNFRVGLPDETFNKQKETAFFTNRSFRWEPEENDNFENNYMFNETTKSRFIDFVQEEGLKNINDNELNNIFKSLLSEYGGDALNEEFLDSVIPKKNKTEWITFIDKVGKHTTTGNPILYFFNKVILNEINVNNKYQVYEDTEYMLGNEVVDKKFVFYFNEQNPISMEIFDRGLKGKDNLEFTDDVIYSSNYVARKHNYKIGQKISLVGKSDENSLKEYTFGGTFSESEKLITYRTKQNEVYFIKSFNGIKDDYKHITAYGINLYNGDTNNLRGDIFNDLKPYLAKETIDAKNQNWIQKADSFSAYYKYYIGMTVLFLTLFFLLLALDILLSFFMIKELIMKNADNMLFLKAMGYKNIELAFLNSLSILAVLFPTFLIAIGGQFLVQSIFTNMIQSYIEIFWSWSTITPWTFPFLIFLVLLNLLFFIVLNTRMISKIQLRDNVVVKSHKVFNILSTQAFRRGTNFGIGVHLYFKNQSKIITTFIISFLIMSFMFVTFGFSVSVDQGGKKYASNYGNYRVGSYFKSQELTEKVKNNKEDEVSPIKYETSINYTNKKLDPKKNLAKLDINSYPNAKKDLTEYYLYRNDIPDVLKIIEDQYPDRAKEVKTKIDYFVNMYENIMTTQFGVSNYNFLMSFGEYHYNESDVADFRTDVVNETNGVFGKVVAVRKESNVYKNIFSKLSKKKDLKTHVDDEGYFHIPVIVGKDNQWNKFENINNAIWKMDYIKGIDNFAPLSNVENDGGLRFKFDLIESKAEMYKQDVFMRRDDLNKFLEWAFENEELYVSEYNESLIKNILNNKLNNYLYSNDNVPSVLRQIVVPKENGNKSINENYLDKIISMSNDVNEVIKLDLFSKKTELMKQEIKPMLTLMNFLLIVSVLIFLVILIFIVIMMTNENFQFIKTMGYLGYSKNYVRLNLISWYIISFALAEIFAVSFAIMLLNVINSDFIEIIKMKISFSFEWQNVLAIILMFVVLTTIVIAFVSRNMSKIVSKQRIE